MHFFYFFLFLITRNGLNNVFLSRICRKLCSLSIAFLTFFYCLRQARMLQNISVVKLFCLDFKKKKLFILNSIFSRRDMLSSNITNDTLNTVAAIMTSIVVFTKYWCIIVSVTGFIGHVLNVIIYIYICSLSYGIGHCWTYSCKLFNLLLVLLGNSNFFVNCLYFSFWKDIPLLVQCIRIGRSVKIMTINTVWGKIILLMVCVWAKMKSVFLDKTWPKIIDHENPESFFSIWRWFPSIEFLFLLLTVYIYMWRKHGCSRSMVSLMSIRMT